MQVWRKTDTISLAVRFCFNRQPWVFNFTNAARNSASTYNLDYIPTALAIIWHINNKKHYKQFAWGKKYIWNEVEIVLPSKRSSPTP